MKPKLNLLLLIILLCSINLKGQNWDIRLLDKINSPVNKCSDKAWSLVSDCSGPLDVAVPVSMLIAGFAAHDKTLQTKSYLAGISLATAFVITSGIKYSVRRPRPFTTYPNIITKKAKGGGHSFPSGHTSSAFAAATSLSLAFPKWYVIVPSYLYASAVAYSRMYLGVHYPSDVIGGIVVGVGSSLLVYECNRWLQKRQNKAKVAYFF
jgi:membrane-associated phospholipid phosphatase